MSAFERIPAELREREFWVVWKWGEPDPTTGKRKKPPYCATDLHRHGSSTNPETWSMFKQAVALVEAGKADGVGFALCPPWVGVDLDEELPEAERYAVARMLDSYTEESVSGTGLHVILRASLNGGRHPEGFGVFQEERLWYCSGKHLAGTPWEIHERQLELDAVLKQYLPKPSPAGNAFVAAPVHLDDQQLLEQAFAARNGEKFHRLWEGDWSGYPSQSDADLALAMHLAFWTGRDAIRMDAMFRASGLYRKKWDRKNKDGRFDYRELTLEKAIASTSEAYHPTGGSELSRGSDAVDSVRPDGDVPGGRRGVRGR